MRCNGPIALDRGDGENLEGLGGTLNEILGVLSESDLISEEPAATSDSTLHCQVCSIYRRNCGKIHKYNA